MRGNASLLAMRADRDRDAQLGKLMCLTRAVVVDIILFRRNFAAGIIGRKLGRRIMLRH